MGNTRVSFARNSAGASEILDTGNYYAFGLNHIGGNGLNSSGFGSWQSYKYNGKELQETGVYDYGARMYMSDLGRWGVIDPLAETSRRFSPYNYAVNNPVMFIDPDGRKVRYYRAPSEETIPQPRGGMLGFLGSGGIPNRAGLLNFLGYGEKIGAFYDYGDGEGGGGGRGGGRGATFDQTQAYRDLMSGRTNSITNVNGYMSWWTGGAAGDANTSQEMIAHMLKLPSSDVPEIRQSYHNFNPYRPDNTPEWYAFGGRANWGIATGAASLENFSGQARVTTYGKSLKLYRPNANGNVFIKNQYTRTASISRIGKGLGTAYFFLGVAFDGIGVLNYMDNPNSSNAVHPGKAGFNTIMGYVGLKGGVAGAIISTVYFGVDNYYPGGWVGASETADRTEKYEQQTTGHPFFSNSALKF